MQSLYQDQLLALARASRSTSAVIAPTHTAEVNNPVCGDRIRAAVTVANGSITHAHAEAKGCALCEAGAGLWLNTVVGRDMAALPDLLDRLTDWLKANDGSGDEAGDESRPDGFSQDIKAFAPVRAIKNRHKCVTLAFATADKFTPV